jgi:hypothetical protein
MGAIVGDDGVLPEPVGEEACATLMVADGDVILLKASSATESIDDLDSDSSTMSATGVLEFFMSEREKRLFVLFVRAIVEDDDRMGDLGGSPAGSFNWSGAYVRMISAIDGTTVFPDVRESTDFSPGGPGLVLKPVCGIGQSTTFRSVTGVESDETSDETPLERESDGADFGE